MHLSALQCAVLVLATVAAAPPCSAQCADGREGRTIFGRRQKPNTVVSAPEGGPVLVGSGADPVRYFRLEVQREPGSTEQGLLVVKDNDLRVIDVFRLRDLPISRPVWTRRGVGNRATLRFEVPGAEQAKVTVVRTIGMPAEVHGSNVYYSLQVDGSPTYHDVYPTPGAPDRASLRAKRLADSVGFLQASYVEGEQTWCCSAVAVDTDLLLTNWHCGGDASMLPERYWDDVCTQTLIDMSWDGDLVSREYQCEKVVADPARDLALLRVRPIDGAGPLVPVRFANEDTSGGVVDLIHHPQCKSKQATEGCRIIGLGPNESAQPAEFTHDCDSEGGSSGAPLFKKIGNQVLFIGLHHAGFRREAGTCKALDKVNRGIRLQEVKAFVAEKRAKLDQP